MNSGRTSGDSSRRYRSIALRILITVLIASMLFGCASSKQKAKDFEVHFMLGVSYLRANDPTSALKEFLLAEAIEQDDAPLQAALGQTYFMKKLFTDSENHYRQAVDLDRNNPKFENNLAALYMEMERWQDAQVLFKKAALNPLFSQAEVAWTGYGYAAFKSGDHLKAIDSYMKAINANVRYPQAYVRRGEAFAALGKPGKAIADYQHALKLYPNYPLAHFNLALVHMNLKEKRLARKHFGEVARLVPESDLGRQSKSYLLILD